MGKLNSSSAGELRENINIPRVLDSYIFHVKQKSKKFPDDEMSKFPNYETNMGKQRPFPGSTLPYRFRVDEMG